MRVVCSIILSLVAMAIFTLPFALFGCKASPPKEATYTNVSSVKVLVNNSSSKNKVEEIIKRGKK